MIAAPKSTAFGLGLTVGQRIKGGVVVITGGDIAQIFTALGAIGAMLSSLRNKASLKEIHLTMNSRLDELIRATHEVALAAGIKQGREDAATDAARIKDSLQSDK